MLITKKTKVPWHPRNINYYESLGYEYTKIGDKIEINVEELPRYSKVTVEVRCDYCNKIFKTRYKVHLDGRRHIQKDSCQQCGKKKVDEISLKERGSLEDNFPELMREWSPKNTIDPSKILSGTRLSAYWICEYGHEWYANIKARAHRGEGCPECYISKGEAKVEESLIKLDAEYIREVSFEGLNGVWGNPLRFDFAVQREGDLLGLIEYDGIFHFEDVYEGCNHRSIVVHDERKMEYCAIHGIPLLIIPYTQFNNINKLVSGFYNEIKEGV